MRANIAEIDKDRDFTLEIPSQAGALINWLHANTEVLERRATKRGALSVPDGGRTRS